MALAVHAHDIFQDGDESVNNDRRKHYVVRASTAVGAVQGLGAVMEGDFDMGEGEVLGLD